MANFTAGTSFSDGVTNDVTAAKLNALVADAVPTSNLALTSTNGTIANFTSSTANITLGTIPTLTAGTTTGTAGVFTSGTITTGLIPTLTAGTTTSTAGVFTSGTITTGLIPTLTAGTTTSTAGVFTSGTITTLNSTTPTFLGAITASTNTINVGSGQIFKDATGNVGIGTASPDAKLAFSGTVGEKISLYNTSNNFRFGLSVGQAGATSFNTRLYGPNYTDAGVQIGTVSTSDGTTFAPAISVIGSGNVGIGTTSPAAELHVATSGSSSIDETLRLDNSSNTPNNGNKITWRNAGQTTECAFISGFRESATTGFGVAIGTSPNFVSGGTNAVERLRIDSSGNVGIGTLSAAGNTLRYFDVQNTTASASSGVDIRLITSDSAGTGTAIVDLVKYKSGGFIIANNETSSSGFTSFNVGASERLRIDSSGNVGIGTTGAVNKLEIVGSFGRGAPVTKTADFSLADTENWLIVNKGSSCTVTLPAASSWTGREFTIKVITAHAVVSASSNIIPRIGGAAATAILPATDGAWATLVSNGTTWEIMCGS